MEAFAVHEHILDEPVPEQAIEADVRDIEITDENEPSSLQIPVRVGETAVAAVTWAIADRDGNRIEITTTEGEQ